MAVIEAGLGGRYDATNVIASRVAVLTNVGLEHTRWLGPTIADIAREKLDVVRPGATLVLGAGLHPDALAVAERGRARARRADRAGRARIRGVPVGRARRLPAPQLRARARRRRGVPRASSTAAAVAAAARRRARAGALAGRSASDPLTLLDGAHNPDGIEALAESLPEFVAGHGRAGRGRLDPRRQGRRRRCSRALLRRAATRSCCTRSHNPRALPPPTLASLAGQLGRTAAPRSCAIRSARWRARASSPGPTASCSPPARST